MSYLAVRNVTLSVPPGGEFMCKHVQWQIQDFPEEGTNSKSDDIIPVGIEPVFYFGDLLTKLTWHYL